MQSPFVIMCSKCRQVTSDSNQLVTAVEAIDALVLDAVVGVRINETIEEEGDAEFRMLSCCVCEAELGRVYRKASSDMQQVVHQPECPRYALHRRALSSYVLGSAGMQHDSSQITLPMVDRASTSTGHVSNSKQTPPDDSIVEQLMRVVLGLDQRLRVLEQHQREHLILDDKEFAGQKRAR